MTATTGLGKNNPAAQAIRYEDVFHPDAESGTPTPPSLTSESSPESSHDLDDYTYDRLYSNSTISSLSPLNSFHKDWHSVPSSSFPAPVPEMSSYRLAHPGLLSMPTDDTETAHRHGTVSMADGPGHAKSMPLAASLPLDTELTRQPWAHDTMPMLMDQPTVSQYRRSFANTAEEPVTVPGMFTMHNVPPEREGVYTTMLEDNQCAPPTMFEGKAGFPEMRRNASSTSSHARTRSMSAADMDTHMAATESDLGVSSTQVIRPDRSQLPPAMEIHVHGVPSVGAKSRVETQIRMRIELVTRNAENAPGWSRIGSFDQLKVPLLSGTKRRSKKHQKINIRPASLLLLEADVINATPPHAHVSVCDSCRERERKRAHRKKSKKLSPTVNPTEEEMQALGIDPAAPGAMELATARMEEEERKHTVLFNSGDYIDFQDGEAILSTRIICYCRHHREKLGFRIVYTLRDHAGAFIATGATPPIMIMDDHKSGTQASITGRAPRKMSTTDVSANERAQTMSLSPTSHSMKSAEAQPSRARDNAKPYDERRRGTERGYSSSSMAGMESNNVSFLLDANRSFLWNSRTMPDATPLLSSPTMSASSQVFQENFAPFDTMSPTSMTEPMNSTETHRPMDLLALGGGSGALFSPVQRSSSHLDEPVHTNAPRITKMIPAEGPTTGGVEITVLGENFREGLQCVFGDVPSVSTHVWAESTLVCVLPPRFRPGPVLVSLQYGPSSSVAPIGNQPLQLFTYIDGTDRALMELALQVVGLQMTGQMTSARDVAMRIVNSQGDGSGATDPPSSQATDTAPMDVNALLAYGLRLCSQSNAARLGVQDAIIGFLSLLDVETATERPRLRLPAILACNKQGHTLLHLAVIHNYHRLVADLLERGCPVNARDRNGYTALHFAALQGSLITTRELLDCGASPYIYTRDRMQAVHVARKAEMIDAEHLLEEYMRDATDEAGWSDASDSDEEAERTPVAHHLPLSTAVGSAATEPCAEREAAEDDTSAADDTPSPGTPPASFKAPAALASPPPTYDEATLDGESAPSRHVLGEKLVTASELETAPQKEAARTAHKPRASGSVARRQSARARERRVKDDKANRKVRARPGVTDDRMLLWFWIPVTVIVCVATACMHPTSFFNPAQSLASAFAAVT